MAWAGRDVLLEEKREYQQISTADRFGKEPPAKRRLRKGPHHCIEVFGQQASRLLEPRYCEFIQQHGLIVAYDLNDVIQFDKLGVPSSASCPIE